MKIFTLAIILNFSLLNASEYWQQFVSYKMNVRLDTIEHTVGGHSTITYKNNSHAQKSMLINEDSLIQETLDIIDEINSLYAEGESTFKDWLKSVKKWNAKLKKKKVSYSIKEFTENELHENCGYYTDYDPINMLNLESRDG